MDSAVYNKICRYCFSAVTIAGTGFFALIGNLSIVLLLLTGTIISIYYESYTRSISASAVTISEYIACHNSTS